MESLNSKLVRNPNTRSKIQLVIQCSVSKIIFLYLQFQYNSGTWVAAHSWGQVLVKGSKPIMLWHAAWQGDQVVTCYVERKEIVNVPTVHWSFLQVFLTLETCVWDRVAVDI